MAERITSSTGGINTAAHDSKGRCVRHPTIRLRKKKFFGGWKIVTGHCPECCLNEMLRVRDEMAKLRQKGDREDGDDDGSDDDDEEEETERLRNRRVGKRKKKRKEEKERKSKQEQEPALSMAFTDPATGNRGTSSYTGRINSSNRMPDGRGVVNYASGIVAEGTWKDGTLAENERIPGPNSSSSPQDADDNQQQRMRSPPSRRHAAREVDDNRGPTSGDLDMLDMLDKREKSKRYHGSTSVRSNDSHDTPNLPSGGASVPMGCVGGGIATHAAVGLQGRFDKSTKNLNDTSGKSRGGNLDLLDRRAKSKANHGSMSVRSDNSHGSLDPPPGSASVPILDYGGGGLVDLSADGSHRRFDKPAKGPHDAYGSFPGGNLDMLGRMDRRAKIGSTSVLSFGSNGSTDDGSKALQIKILQLENSLKDAIFELDKSQRSHEKLKFDISRLQIENAALLKKIVDDQGQNLSEKDAIMDELNQLKFDISGLQIENAALLKKIVDDRGQNLSEKDAIMDQLNQLKLEKVKLEVDLSELRSWSDTARSYLPEVEAKLRQITAERDNLMTQDSYSSASLDYNQLYDHFQRELDEKNEELDRMRSQLIQNADECDAKTDKLRENLEVERERADGLSQERASLPAIVEELSQEKEHPACTLSEGQAAAPGSVDVSTIDADTQVGEAQLCMSDLEAPNVCASQAEVDSLTPLEEKVTAVIAEYDGVQSHLNGITEEYEICQVLELGNSSIQNIEMLSLEEEHVICTISGGNMIPDSFNLSAVVDSDTQVEEAQLSIFDVKEVFQCASEAEVDNLIPLEEEQVTEVTAA